MSELSTPMPDPVEEESHDIPVTRRQLLRTMAAGGVALAGGTALAACGGSPSTSATSNGPVDLTLWMNRRYQGFLPRRTIGAFTRL